MYEHVYRMQVADQSKFLSSHVVDIGVGTAQRISQLVTSSALRTDCLAAFVLDGRIDSKQRHLLDSIHDADCIIKLLYRILLNGEKTQLVLL